MNIIFLDIDGVLNGYSEFQGKIFSVIHRLHLMSTVRKIYDLFGIRTWKVFLLSKICKYGNAKVVLSSSWRGQWNRPYDECTKRMKSLKKKLKFFDVKVIDITKRIHGGNRGEEIRDYLNTHNDIDNFVILDDEVFDIKDMFPDNYVRTTYKYDGKICGAWYENTGLRICHCIKAIKILKGFANG